MGECGVYLSKVFRLFKWLQTEQILNMQFKSSACHYNSFKQDIAGGWGVLQQTTTTRNSWRGTSRSAQLWVQDDTVSKYYTDSSHLHLSYYLTVLNLSHLLDLCFGCFDLYFYSILTVWFLICFTDCFWELMRWFLCISVNWCKGFQAEEAEYKFL